LISIEGERDGETLKLRAQSIESLDVAAEGVQKGLKVVLDHRTIQANKLALGELKASLKPGGKSIVSLSMILGDAGQELEIALPGRFDISPVRKSELVTVPGVLEVIDF
jgi:DNA polymerase III subunit alpha